MSETISSGDYVVITKCFDSGNTKILQVNGNKIVHYGKLHFDPSTLIGATYGTIYEIVDKKLVEVKDFDLFDSNLSDKIANNLLRFNEKSEFSQQKIVKNKKKKNYANVVSVVKPTLALVHQSLYGRNKIGGIRADILAQILTSSNVQSGSRCMVLDHNLGILAAAIMSRILPNGVCIQLIQDYELLHTTRATINMLNIREENCSKCLLALTVRDLYKISKNADTFDYENEILRARNEDHLDRLSCTSSQHSTRDPIKNVKIQDESEQSSKAQMQQILVRKESNRESRFRERLEACRILKQEPLDSVILVAQNDHPLPLINLTYPYLAMSGQIVVYSDSIEPLLECYHYLKSNCLAVSLNLTDSWFRTCQVLPDRTRPEMITLGYGGYLLSATKAYYGTVQEVGNGQASSEAGRIEETMDGIVDAAHELEEK